MIFTSNHFGVTRLFLTPFHSHRLKRLLWHEDDVGGGAGLARIGNVNHWLVGVTGVDLGHVSNEVARSESKSNAHIHLPVVNSLDLVVRHVELELGWESTEGDSQGDHGHQSGTDLKLPLEGGLDLGNVLGRGHVRGNEGGKEANNNAAGSEHERVAHGRPVVGSSEAVSVDAPSGSEGGEGGDDKRSASGLGEGTEQVGAHTGNVSDVVTDVVGDDGGVSWVV